MLNKLKVRVTCVDEMDEIVLANLAKFSISSMCATKMVLKLKNPSDMSHIIMQQQEQHDQHQSNESLGGEAFFIKSEL